MKADKTRKEVQRKAREINDWVYAQFYCLTSVQIDLQLRFQILDQVDGQVYDLLEEKFYESR